MAYAHRSEDRVSMAVPVSLLDGGSGTTRDLSASGIYFETDREPGFASPLDFSVEFASGAGGMTLRCRGQVIRVERLGNRIGVAARILESRLEPGRARATAAPLEITDGFADFF